MKVSSRLAQRFGAVAVITAFAVALASCGSNDEAKSGASKGEEKLTNVRVAFNPGTQLGLYAALSAGLFKKHGLDVKLIQFENGAATNAAFASGGVDLGYSGIPGVLATRLSSDNHVFMIDNDGGNAGGLVVTPNSNISSVADLEGKTIGTVIGTTAWMGLITAMKAEGVDASKVKIENVGPAAWVPAFNKGDVDGIWGWAPQIFQLEKGSGGKIVATDSKYMRNATMWQVRGDFLKQNKKAVEAFVAAYDEASALVDKRDGAFLREMQQRTGVDEITVRKTVEALKSVSVEESVSDASPYSLTNPEGLAAIIDQWATVLVKEKILRTKPDLTGLVDPAPIRGYLASK